MSSEKQRLYKRRINFLDRSICDLQDDLVDLFKEDIKERHIAIPKIEDMLAQANELALILEAYPVLRSSLNLSEVFQEILQTCKYFVSQGARSKELPILYQAIAECSRHLGRFRDARRYNSLALKFQPDFEEALEFRKETASLTSKHATRGLMFVALVGAAVAFFRRYVTKRLTGMRSTPEYTE
ncbi:hypothetical protein AAMO2058_001388400 [Amorphochlora amoebiformis]|mmetsp:Transcript_34866/g.56248  ORF Transcript_34866/g.56248 Transcript_34866/m.56248 type:complete len:184 (-) Transcript_34866:126-677(-)